MAPTPWLVELASRVSDGAPIDWAAALSRAANDSERQVILHLRSIDWIAQIHSDAPGENPGQTLQESLLHPDGLDTDESTPVTWGPLTILEKVGRGRYGDVYRARDPRLDRPVALKLIRRRTLHADAVESAVIEEGRLLARLRHPNIVSVYGAERIDGRVGLWMEFLDGRTLEDELTTDGPFDATRLLEVGRALCDALSAVHDAGLLHRDLKSQNVMRAADGRIVLTDFGAGHEVTDAAGSPTSASPALVGTPLYLSPEVLAGQPPSVQSDLYSLGILLYHLASGTFPITARSLRDLRDGHARASGSSVTTSRPDLPRRLSAVIDGLMALSRTEPFGSAEQAGAALHRIKAGRAARSRRTPENAAAASGTRNRPRIITPRAIGAAFAVALLAWFAWAGVVKLRSARANHPAAPPGNQALMFESALSVPSLDLDDEFGLRVAISGDTIVVGAPAEDSAARGVNGDQYNNSAFNSGAAYVFVRRDDKWVLQAYLKASNANGGDRFGEGVAISGDVIVVGAPAEGSRSTGINGDQNDNSAFETGAAYVFVRTGTTWTQHAYLKASNARLGDHFGFFVAVDRETIAVAAYLEDGGATGVNGDSVDGAEDSGAVYVFVRDGNGWRQQAYVKASNTGAGDHFGGSLGLSGDTMVVGAVYEDSSAAASKGHPDDLQRNAGAAYVFVRAGESWHQEAFLKASNVEARDNFGIAVAVDGDTVAVGAAAEDSDGHGRDRSPTDNSAISAGAVYVFVRELGTWHQQQYLKASNVGAYDQFGASVSVSGNRLVAGAISEDGGVGGVDGNGADNSVADSGAIYLLARDNNLWHQRAYAKTPNPEVKAVLGTVFVSGDYVVAGAYQGNVPAGAGTGVTGSGAAFVWRVSK